MSKYAFLQLPSIHFYPTCFTHFEVLKPKLQHHALNAKLNKENLWGATKFHPISYPYMLIYAGPPACKPCVHLYRAGQLVPVPLSLTMLYILNILRETLSTTSIYSR